MSHEDYAECPYCGVTAYGSDEIEELFGYDGKEPELYCRECRIQGADKADLLDLACAIGRKVFADDEYDDEYDGEYDDEYDDESEDEYYRKSKYDSSMFVNVVSGIIRGIPDIINYDNEYDDEYDSEYDDEDD